MLYHSWNRGLVSNLHEGLSTQPRLIGWSTTADLEDELRQLRGSHAPGVQVPAMFAESIRLAFLGTGGDPDKLASFLSAEQARRSISPRSSGVGIGESSIGWRLTRPALARALSLHLMTCTSMTLTIVVRSLS